MQNAHEVLIGLEALKGDRLDGLKKILKTISDFVQVKAVSSVYEEFERSGGGLCVVVKASTTLLPQELWQRLQISEVQMNSGLRSIDIDLLAAGQYVRMTPQLTLPHPEFHRRPEVLIPAVEVWPEFRHPIVEKPIRELVKRFDRSYWGQFFTSGKTLLDF